MSAPILIVFARIPRLGAGKRRLARRIGDRAALRLSRTMLQALLRRLRPMRGITRLLAATPDHHAKFPAPGFTRIPQGRGDLGARMAAAFRRHPRRSVILIGSDIPDIRPSDIRTTIRLLRGTASVFGPTFDGGYWLVAMSARRPATPFANTSWSTPHALADTLENFRHRPTFLRQLADVDE